MVDLGFKVPPSCKYQSIGLWAISFGTAHASAGCPGFWGVTCNWLLPGEEAVDWPGHGQGQKLGRLTSCCLIKLSRTSCYLMELLPLIEEKGKMEAMQEPCIWWTWIYGDAKYKTLNVFNFGQKLPKSYQHWHGTYGQFWKNDTVLLPLCFIP